MPRATRARAAKGALREKSAGEVNVEATLQISEEATDSKQHVHSYGPDTPARGRSEAHVAAFPEVPGTDAGGEEVRGAAPVFPAEGPRSGKKQKGFDQQWREESLQNVLGSGSDIERGGDG